MKGRRNSGDAIRATSTPTYATDINRDSKVDVGDLLILMEDWRKVSGP